MASGGFQADVKALKKALSAKHLRELISGDQNGNIRVWDLTANSCSCELERSRGRYSSKVLNSDLSPEFCEPHRYLATTSADHTVKIWNVNGFTLEKTLVGHQCWVWDCVFSVDGAYLITGHKHSNSCRSSPTYLHRHLVIFLYYISTWILTKSSWL
ncbi:hypothetical protein MKW98_014446 [Papaver atlanticum]|uniref:Target of rapamycin complex subunit LST8 n=1 Tax=Papaver atlanticum TaxID=357466 RepID=A0AAD4X6J3_9MAGN|nr:hypothetical protein MKW98_014446 [Papaver atlanticum]